MKAVWWRRLAVPLALMTVTAVLDAGLYATLVSPSRQTLGGNDSAWKAERDRIARYKNYQRVYADVTALAARATDRNQLPAVITTVASLAKKRGLKIPEVRYQSEKLDLQDFQKVGVTFGVSGPYADVRRFLNDLERASPFLAVESLALTRARDTEAAQLEVQVKIAAYLKTG